MADSYFVREGDAIVPTELCGGPWDPSFAAGGPVAGLIAHEARSAVEGGDNLLLARLTVDLMRPVPLAPLEVETREVVGRRRLKLVDVDVRAEGELLVRASAQFLAPTDVDHGLAVPQLPRLPDPEGLPTDPAVSAFGRYFVTVERRNVRPIPSPESDVLNAVWMRLATPLLPGVPTTPTLAAAFLAEGSFSGTTVTTKGMGYINSDFTVYCGREPRGEWIAMDGRMRMIGRGTALGSTLLHDIDGPFAQVTAVGVAQAQAAGAG